MKTKRMIRETQKTMPAPRRGFTLVEMIIAIGIVVLLTALTVSASIVLVNRAEVRRTESVIELLDTAVQEWETRADRKVSWGPNSPFSTPANVLYEMGLDTPDLLTATELLQRLRRNEDVNSILTKIKPDQLVKYDSTQPTAPTWFLLLEPADNPTALAFYNSGALNGPPANPTPAALAVLDAWGNPIIAVHPGRLHDPTLPPNGPGDPDALRDTDGTIRNSLLIGFGTGSEERYGIAKKRTVYFMSAGPDGAYGDLQNNPEAVQDNIYSYQVDLP